MKNRILKNNSNEIKIRKMIGSLLDENWKAVNFDINRDMDPEYPEDDHIIVWGDRIDQIILGIDNLGIRNLI